ncbi:MAG: bifunctional diguanylate cyclase/phosphodiesterase [Lachnospiraceae bacterium]|nr:bifunctional diguanylate cyclase/phosphodiesterase [Lachnospiraceae bacterium]
MEDTQYQIDLLTAINERLMNSEHVYKLACEFSGAAYIYFDLKNEHRIEMFGAWDKLVGENLTRQPYDENYLISFVCDEDQKKVRDFLNSFPSINDSLSASIEFTSKKSKKCISARRIFFKDNNGKFIEKLISVEDITQIKNKSEELEYYAYYDVLTSLYNRNHFFTVLRDLLEKASKENTSVELMLVDIDNFKKINDSLGLVYGDELVQSLALFIKSLSTDKIKVGRYGSDVFAIAIFDPCGKNCSDMIFKTIRDRVKKPFILTNKAEVTISVSAGVCEYPGCGHDALELIKNAEIVLYASKQHEKGSISYFSDEILKVYQEEIVLENKLNDAILNNELSVYFQPQYDANTGALRGAEALIRWLDENENVVYRPLDFIPLAEKNGTIIEIGNFVFREVFKSIHEWKVKYRANYIISINVSAIQLQRSDFIDNLQKLIDYYEVDPGLIELEITESVLINDFDTMIETLRILSQLGIRVSLDDFGTGFSSLSYLRELPITTLKIDKSFIDDICINNKTANITGSVVDMVKKLDLETVAEGVEHKEQLDCLKDMGCDLIQGFLLSKPVKKSEFEKIIIRQMP